MNKLNENYWLLGVIVLLLWSLLAGGSATAGNLALVELLVLGLSGYWLFKEMISRRLTWSKTALNFFIGLFLLLGLGQLYSVSLYPYATGQELIKLFVYSLVFFLVINNLRRRAQINILCAAIVGIGLLVAVLGLIKKSVFINYNHFAGYLEMAIPLTLGFIFAREKQDLAIKIILIFCLVVMLGTLFFTLSRGGIFSLMFSLLFFIPLISRIKGYQKTAYFVFPIFILSFIFICWIGSGPLVDRLQSLAGVQNTHSYTSRIGVWQDTLSLIKDNFWLGAGLGTYKHVFPAYKTLSERLLFSHAHNEYLELFSEAGLAGLIIFLGGIVYYLSRLVGFVLGRQSGYSASLTCGCLVSVIAILVHSFVDFGLRIPANALLLAVIAGIGFKLSEKNSGREIVLGPVTRWAGLVGLATILFLITGQVVKVMAAEHWAKKVSSAQLSRNEKINYLTKAIKLSPANSEYFFLLAKEEEQINPQKSLNFLQQANRLNPQHSLYYRKTALLLSKLGKEEEAGPLLTQAMKSEPANSEGYYLSGWYYLNRARNCSGIQQEFYLQKSREFFRQAVELNPGLAKETVKNYFQVKRRYTDLKEILPNEPTWHAYLANFLQENQAWEENLTDFKKDLASAPDKTLYLKALAADYYRQKKYTQAISLLKEFVQKYPDKAELHFTLADWLFYHTEEKKLVFQEAERALQLDPNNNYYRYWYAKWFYYLREYEKSLAQCQKILSLNPQDKLTQELKDRCSEKL